MYTRDSCLCGQDRSGAGFHPPAMNIWGGWFTEGSPQGQQCTHSGQFSGRAGAVGVARNWPGLLVQSGLICRGQLLRRGLRQRSQMVLHLIN